VTPGVPAASVTGARYRSGTAEAMARTVSVLIGSTFALRGFGTLTPAHGDDAMRRSSTAASLPTKLANRECTRCVGQ
jgi:hypothetical protein